MNTINREIVRISFPSILANITVPLVGMVDIAVVGHLGSSADSAGGIFSAAALIGGIAVGTMLFDLLYWNFGFLRVGTGGLTAQSYGRSDMEGCSRILVRALAISTVSALALIAVQWLVVQFAFLFVKCSPEVRQLASDYFYIRIWAAPATLGLMAFKGWFIGMQDSISPMVTDLVVNSANIVASIVLALGISIGSVSWGGMGFNGVALGTVIAQYSGLVCAIVFLRRKYMSGAKADMTFNISGDVFRGADLKSFFSMNADIFVRSLCFIAIYIGFTVISAGFGDVLLASCSIMMKLMMVFSYFTDGFAYAGEALTGRCIGARDSVGLRQTVKYTFVWSIGLSVIFIALYGGLGVPMLRLMTSDAAVVDASRDFLPWLVLMPVVGVAAFAWDGIFIGATDSKGIRNAMLYSVLAFCIVWAAGKPFDLPSDGSVHLLMGAYMAHLLARTVYLSIRYHSRSLMS